MQSMNMEKLKARWLKIVGTPMPEDIASLPVEIVRKAVKWKAAGVEVVVPKLSLVIADEESSLRDWDGESNN